jgi:hypothetical protein
MPPPRPDVVTIELAETLVGSCEKCGHVHQTGKPIHDPDPPPSPPSSPNGGSPAPSPETPPLPAAAAVRPEPSSNVVPLRGQGGGSIHDPLPTGERPPLKKLQPYYAEATGTNGNPFAAGPRPRL